MSELPLSVVTPAYRCAECIPELHRRLTLVLRDLVPDYEIVFVNDCSPDRDWEIIKELAQIDPHVRGLSLSRNFGQHHALTAGLDATRGRHVVVMDCDLQDRPEEIPAMYRKVLEGHDAVVARRIDRQDGWFKRTTSHLFAAFLGYMTDTRFDRAISNFGVYSESVIAAVRMMREQNRSFPLMVRWLGFQVATLDVQHSQRFAGRTAYTLRRLLRFAISSIVSQSNKPLRMIIALGFTIAAMAMMVGCFFIWRYYVRGVGVEGWTSIIVSLFLLSGLQFIAVGVLGIYVGRVFNETKARPLYVLREEVGTPRLEPQTRPQPRARAWPASRADSPT